MNAKTSDPHNPNNNTNIIKYIEFFIGLAIGLCTLYYTSTQWEKNQIEVLYELRELRRENIRINDDLSKISISTKNSEQMILRHDIKLNVLELKIDGIEKEFKEIIKKK